MFYFSRVITITNEDNYIGIYGVYISWKAATFIFMEPGNKIPISQTGMAKCLCYIDPRAQSIQVKEGMFAPKANTINRCGNNAKIGGFCLECSINGEPFEWNVNQLLPQQKALTDLIKDLLSQINEDWADAGRGFPDHIKTSIETNLGTTEDKDPFDLLLYIDNIEKERWY